jgi:3-oxoacyl-[acyl-carrier-protein] synthase-1
MVVPSADAAAVAMQAALAEAGLERVDYVNTHAIGSEAGDMAELEALRQVFGKALPLVSSTKGLSGHSLGASAAQEAIYALLMLKAGFVAGCANLQRLDPAAAGFPLVTGCVQGRVASVMSNSFGFGGTNASLILRSLTA